VLLFRNIDKNNAILTDPIRSVGHPRASDVSPISVGRTQIVLRRKTVGPVIEKSKLM
jgi:hypothetical protein